MGVAATQEDMDLFEKMNHQVTTLTHDELKYLGAMLTSFLQGNRKGGYLNTLWFETTLVTKWYETCSNHTYNGWFIWQLYWKFSDLSYPISNLVPITKFLIKVLTRKK